MIKKCHCGAWSICADAIYALHCDSSLFRLFFWDGGGANLVGLLFYYNHIIYIIFHSKRISLFFAGSTPPAYNSTRDTGPVHSADTETTCSEKDQSCHRYRPVNRRSTIWSWYFHHQRQWWATAQEIKNWHGMLKNTRHWFCSLSVTLLLLGHPYLLFFGNLTDSVFFTKCSLYSNI